MELVLIAVAAICAGEYTGSWVVGVGTFCGVLSMAPYHYTHFKGPE